MMDPPHCTLQLRRAILRLSAFYLSLVQTVTRPLLMEKLLVIWHSASAMRMFLACCKELHSDEFFAVVKLYIHSVWSTHEFHG